MVGKDPLVMLLANVIDTIHANRLALFALIIDILLHILIKPEKLNN